MSNFWVEIEDFEQREQLYVEAAGYTAAAAALTANAAAIGEYLGTAAGEGVPALLAAVEKADAKVPEAVFINAMLSIGATDLEAEVAPLLAQGTALLPAVAAALTAEAAKLSAKAATL